MRLFPLFFALLLTSSSIAQNFGGLWQEVDEFTRNGQPKSALEVIEKIHDQALKQNNGPQLIKAVIHEVKFNSQFEDESLVASIARLEDEAQRLQSPTKEIIHSLLAEMYWGYYQNNSWQIQKRTATTKEDGNILTWDFKRIVQEADRNYELSLVNALALRSAKLESYEPILTGSETYRDMRPSLYHLLLSRAMDFYTSEQRELINFDRSGVYNDARLIGDQATFLTWKAETDDGLSPANTTIGLFQVLLREAEQLNDEARVAEDLRRLKFMHRRAQLAEKDSLYEASLDQLLSSHTDQPIFAEITYHIANLYYQLGSNGSTKDSTVQWNWKTAYELCESVVGDYPNSFGSRNCKSLMEQIAMKSFRIQAEKVVLPEKPFRVLVNYRNVGKVKSAEWTVYAQIAKIDPMKYRAEAKRNYGEKRVKWLKANSTAVTETSFNLPNPGDFKGHNMELPLDELPVGTYVVFLGTDKSHSTSNQAVAYALITVSDIALLKRNEPAGKIRIKVVSRNTGKPLVNARIDLLSLVYDRKTRSNSYELNKQLQTNENGEAFWSADGQNYRGMTVDVYHGNDRLINADNIYGRSNRENVQWYEQTHFFLDRAIYRPGQTIHFKGIMLSSNGIEVKTVTDTNTKVELFDANGQEVSSLDLVSNGFGTFSGTFIVPTGGLNGMIRIGNETGSHSFRMEEYKRPKFEVTVNRPTDQFRVNDTVSVTGTAVSYAGIPLDGAEVKYRVTRTARYPFPWLCWGWYPRSDPKQVAFGTAISNSVGEFTIAFQAQPDPLVQPKYRPVFSYNVEVDVADKSGEMQTGNTTVSVGYHALNLSIELPSIIDRDNLKDYGVSATNLSGEKQDAKVTVKVWTLKQNSRILRKRLWQQPDQFLLSESVYQRKFQNDPYKDEGNFQTWEKDRIMLDTKFDTETVSTVSLEPLNTLPQGYYLVELISKDAFGTEVTQRAYFNMIGRFERVPPISTTAWFHTLKDTFEPGDELELLVGSSYASMDFLVEVEVKDKGSRSNKIIHSETVSVAGSQERIVILVTESWRGNAQIHVTGVRNNEQLSWSKTISVPYTNKQLDVKLETFRKEMAPDDAEEWTLKITDKDGRPVKAELLSTMYDASLDVLAANNWGLQPYRFLNARFQWTSSSFGRAKAQVWDRNWKRHASSGISRNFEKIDWFGYYIGRRGFVGMESMALGGARGRNEQAPVMMKSAEIRLGEVQIADSDAADIEFEEERNDDKTKSGDSATPLLPKDIKMRTDFSETVFFHPHLETDKQGNVSFKFKAPQSLTRWKFMGLATTEDLKIGAVTEEVVTRKQLMITPNYPRFVREGDKLLFQVKINALDSTISEVSASLELKDGLTLEPLQLKIPKRQLSIENGQAIASWTVDIPEGIAAIKFTTKAWSESHSDGEEKTIPVLSNRMLVTESMPLPVRGKGTHSFTFNKLKNSNSSSLRNHALTLEFTPNPIWLAVLSLPYMMEYPYDCSEQIFSRYYSNAIGSYLANSDPAIKRVFDQWKRDAQNNEGDAFLSELEKNPELKQALLTETPWVRDAQNETEQRRRIAELFDTDRMESELKAALNKLKQNQQVDGGWGWFNGLRSDMYITRYIVSGFGKMRKMGVWQMDGETRTMLEKAMEYLDEEMVKYYNRRALKKEDYVPTWTDLHMTYARSFWLEDFKLNGKAKTTYNAILKTIREKWTKLDASQKGLAAVVLNRSGFETDAKKVIVSLRETALTSEEFGTYWAMDKGYYWHQAPIENHVMILEAFDEVAKDEEMISEMNIWLLKQKQTQSWETTKATAEACYALLSTGNTDFETEPLVSIQMGKETIDPRKDPDLKTEAGTGYFKTNWSGRGVTADMGNVTVTKENEGVAWGAVYWQYFEDLDKITGVQDNPIKMERQVMLLEDTENGPIMKPLDENTSLSVGDRVKVRIVLNTDRHMEYVHLKDMRAASFEPREQLSGPRSQEGLYYYQSPTDAAMNFFFGYLPKGTFVFEYDLNVTQAGQFSNGISQLQCMYAPEFTTHTEGMRLEIGR